MKKIFLLFTLILHFAYQAKAQSSLQFEKVYQTNWYSNILISKVSEHKVLLYNNSNSKLFTIDTLGNADSLFALPQNFGGGIMLNILQSNIDSGTIHLTDLNGCDFLANGFARIKKVNQQGNIVWSLDSLNDKNFSSAIAKYLNGYLFSSLKYTNNAQSYPVQLARINEAGQIHFYPEINVIAETQNLVVANNKILIPIVDSLNNSTYALFDTVGNYSIIPVLPGNTPKNWIAADDTNIYVVNNLMLKKLNGNFSVTAQYNLLSINNFGSTIQVVKNDSIIWLLSKKPQNKYGIYKFSTNLTLIDSITLDNYFPSNALLGGLFFIGNKLIIAGRNITHQNSQPFLKSFDKYTLQTTNNINQPIISNLSISNIGGQANWNGSFAPYSVYFHFDATATIKNNGAATLHSLVLNAPENGLSIGWGFCQEINISQKFNNLNILPGDSANLTFTYSSSRHSWTGSFLFSNFYLWCSAPNNELNSADNTIDTVQTNIFIENLIGVGMDEMFDNDVLQIYPNPFTNNDVLHFKNVSSNVTNCKVYNIAGDVVEEFEINGNHEYQLKNKLVSGLYFLTYNNSLRTLKCTKLMKY